VWMRATGLLVETANKLDDVGEETPSEQKA
jgi:hypothetical protein